MSGVMSAPPRREVRVVAEMAGLADGAMGRHPKARAWLLDASTSDSGQPELVLYVPDPRGNAQRLVAQVLRAEVSQPRWQVETDRGTVLLVRAPCNCGFGSVAMAGPVDERHAVVMVAVPSWAGGDTAQAP